MAELIAGGSLMPLLADVHYAEPLRILAICLEGRHRLPKVRVFLDFFIERFGSTPWRVGMVKSRAKAGAR